MRPSSRKFMELELRGMVHRMFPLSVMQRTCTSTFGHPTSAFKNGPVSRKLSMRCFRAARLCVMAICTPMIDPASVLMSMRPLPPGSHALMRCSSGPKRGYQMAVQPDHSIIVVAMEGGRGQVQYGIQVIVTAFGSTAAPHQSMGTGRQGSHRHQYRGRVDHW